MSPTPTASTSTGPRPTPLVRTAEGRRAGGVAVALAQHLGVPVGRVRAAFVALTLLGGTGAALYAAYWFLVPDARDVAEQAGAPDRRRDPSGWVLEHRDTLLGVGLVSAGALAVMQLGGFGLSGTLIVAVLVVGAGLVLAWSQLDATRRRRIVADAGGGGRAALRVGAGVTLVVVGVVLLFVAGGDVGELGQAVLAMAAVLLGVGIVLAPWAVRLWTDLGAERAALAREQERAELAAHVHDSVLQTLALIQKRHADGAEVARLARAQERDLRGWLYGDHGTVEGTLGAALRAAAAEVEDVSTATVEVVLVGDLDSTPLTRSSSALAQAAREALLNAGRHAGGTVSLYAELSASTVEVFVRDRGPGFDLDTVPADRLGVRESVLGRMRRAGGAATIRRPDQGGTEIVLELPVAEGVS